MAGELVLVTGVTGFLGYKVIVDLLKHGYRVRGVVRSLAKAAKVKNAPSIKALNPTEKQLSFVEVEDMTLPGAYDEAVKGGVTYVIHVASPIPSFGEGEPPKPEDLEDIFVKTAPKGAVGMLESAQRAGTVKRVVMTSSVVAIAPFDVYMGQGKEPDKVWTPESRIPVAPAPYGFEFEAYSAGKAAALNESEAWMAKNKPSFDLIPVIPSWIFGPDELSTSAESMRVGSTNAVLLGVVTGQENPSPYSGNAVYGKDVARTHVASLDPKIKGNQSFVVNTPIVWEDAITIAKKHFPEAFADGRLTPGKQPTMPLAWESNKVRLLTEIQRCRFTDIVGIDRHRIFSGSSTRRTRLWSRAS